MKTLNRSPEHPANEELAAFALGKELANAETIAEHIANCALCETIVAKTPRDTFLGILYNAKPGSSLTGAYVPKAHAPTADELPEELRQQTKYTFLKKLGGGGMGVVYLAEHNLMKRKVAVKLIPPEMIGNPAVRERFLQEVVSAAALEHPNVVYAYAAEEFGRHMAFEMEFVDGKDLGQVVKSKGPLPIAHAVNYIRQAAQGLQHGMLKLLVHRDIKPGNLMLTRTGNVKVADFGLAKFSRESEKGRDRSLTGDYAMMGTPDYMAPEQARNAKSADIRADIYSLGCTFYYLLTGQPPFTGESIAELMFKHWEAPRPDVGLVRNDVPKELSQYIREMMAKESSDRPQTPKEVVDWLVKFTKGAVPPTIETKVAVTEPGAAPARTSPPPLARPVMPSSSSANAWEVLISGKTTEKASIHNSVRNKRWSLQLAVVLVMVLVAAGVLMVTTKNRMMSLEKLGGSAARPVDRETAMVPSIGKASEIPVAADKKQILAVKKDDIKIFKKEPSYEPIIAVGQLWSGSAVWNKGRNANSAAANGFSYTIEIIELDGKSFKGKYSWHNGPQGRPDQRGGGNVTGVFDADGIHWSHDDAKEDGALKNSVITFRMICPHSSGIGVISLRK